MYKLFVISTFGFYLIVTVQSACSSDKDKGDNNCDSVESIRWYHNEKKFRCMAFTYLGCGGNDNNFLTYDACQAKCSIADGPACLSAAFSQPPRMPAWAHRLGPRWCQTVGCPGGYECQNGGLVSQCCNSSTESFDVCLKIVSSVILKFILLYLTQIDARRRTLTRVGSCQQLIHIWARRHALTRVGTRQA
uniref:BPTI/Kunitz inhibitor domain-containing protein n=1 Tax=Romanomermis culicivorax TaxID=13658 RepID=A0A915IET5_ROMCU